MLMRSIASVYSPMRASGMHHVLVDLEGVGVAGDRGGAGAVEPELAPRFGADRDEALAAARIGDAHDLGGGRGHRGLVVADDVAEQRHLRQRAALGLGGVADRAQVALVQVLEAREPHAAARSPGRPGSP